MHVQVRNVDSTAEEAGGGRTWEGLPELRQQLRRVDKVPPLPRLAIQEKHKWLKVTD